MTYFSSWSDLFRILVVATLAYAGLVFMLRISGNRTLSKMNSFDLIVTIALGSTLSSGILQKSVPLSDTFLALGLLIGFQYIITWLSVRSQTFEKVVKASPVLVFRSGRFLEHAMKQSRVTKEEIVSAVREQGMTDLETIAAVVLEADGRLTAIGPRPASGELVPSPT